MVLAFGVGAPLGVRAQLQQLQQQQQQLGVGGGAAHSHPARQNAAGGTRRVRSAAAARLNGQRLSMGERAEGAGPHGRHRGALPHAHEEMSGNASGCACCVTSLLDHVPAHEHGEHEDADSAETASATSPSVSRRQALGAALTSGLAASAVAWPVAPQPAAADAPGKWGYQKDNGPAKWGYLEDKFKICLDAPHQSPIDLRTDIPGVAGFVSKNDVTAKLQTPRLKFAANPTFQGKRTRPGGPFSFPQVASDAEPAIRMLLPNGFVYKFLQFHFHTSSSEHALRGEKGIAEVHFVFGLDKEASADRPVWAGDNAPSNAVVGVLYRESPNPCQWTETVLKSLPNPNAPEAGGQPLKAGSLKDFVPTFEKAAYFNYMGSLTTPPCSEGILWFVFSRTAQMTMDQMARLQAVQGGANWRPLQLSGKERGSRYYMPVTEL